MVNGHGLVEAWDGDVAHHTRAREVEQTAVLLAKLGSHRGLNGIPATFGSRDARKPREFGIVNAGSFHELRRLLIGELVDRLTILLEHARGVAQVEHIRDGRVEHQQQTADDRQG